MTPHEFLTKWRHVELKERSASQSHFNDLCALLGVPDPISADPTGEWFTFEKGASKTSGGEGWADVWRRGHFGWEYKGRHANLDRAYNQLLQYSVALENPPLLIVSDMDRIVIRTNWTNSVQERHDFALEDLIDGAVRDRLKAAFTDPEAFRPRKSRQELTEETAAEFAGLAQRLRERGHDPQEVAHFVNRLVFCMFAEDVGLLPDNLFTKMLEVSRRDPAEFAENARTLFAAMAHRGGKVGFTAINWFNGGLFEDDRTLPVSEDDIDALLRAANQQWDQIDPSILGTLFERGLDPAKRSQLGAHYTDRDKIMMIVKPTVIEPLEAEWTALTAKIAAAMERVAEAKARVPTKQSEARKVYAAARRAEEAAYREAQRLRNEFLVRLRRFRVLDPACGSGNFLYLALRALKDIEHRANIDAEALGLDKAAPAVGPECVLGIELNPYAAELARVSVWIGEIQWMRRNGFPAATNPILKPLDTIECRDAVLNEDGTRAEWPEADVIIGNPPFLGGKRLRAELGDTYVNALFAAYRDRVPQEADLVAYWVARGWEAVVSGRASRVGLVTTNSIRGGANRRVLAPIAEAGGFFAVWSDEPWTVDGAAVRVSLAAFRNEAAPAPHLDGHVVEKINADLTGAAFDLTKAARMGENEGIAFMGDTKGGAFDIPGELARAWLGLPVNPNGRRNIDVLRPWVNGMDLTRRPSGKWIIDFGWSMSEAEAALYEAPFAYVAEHVRPERSGNRREQYARFWWRHVEPRQGMWAKLAGLQRYLATPRVAKHRLFVFLPAAVVPDSQVIAIARDDDTCFGILHSRFHEVWALRMGTSLEDRPRYTPSTTFETFPFPEGLTPDIPASAYAKDPRARAVAAAAARLNELRENWLNPADLVSREPEVVPAHPERVLAKDEDAANELKKRTLTNLYNARPQWLANAHAALDTAVADAYGWGDDWRAGALMDEEILARLFLLNEQRASTTSS